MKAQSTLIPDGTIFYCNTRFGEMVQMDSEKLIGIRFQDLILPEEQKTFEALFTKAGRNGSRGEFSLKASSGNSIPVQLSIYELEGDTTGGISIIATDISEQVQAEDENPHPGLPTGHRRAGGTAPHLPDFA